MSRRRIVLATALVFGASLALARVHPFGDAGLDTASAPPSEIHLSASIPSEVSPILITKCADCHSTQTHTPLYGHLAPISWLMERDILEGRKHLNLSHWDSYPENQQQTLKAKIAQETKAHEMPLLQYRMIHWKSALTSTDLLTLTHWAHDASTVDSNTQIATAGDPVHGNAVFERRCTGCHSLTQNHEGPRLQGIYGRPTGAVAGFPYSDALRRANIRWNDQTLDRWLKDPDVFLPGNNMDFLVPNPQERKDLIAYFRQSAGN